MHNIEHNTNVDMLIDEIITPLLSGIHSWAEHTIGKLIILSGSVVTFLSLDLFTTPEYWWKTLVYLVLIDWASGTIVALYEEKFDRRLFLRKAYVATGYMMIAGSSALMANSMPEIFYYTQFIVYASIFSIEFYSILNTWRFWATFVAFAKVVFKGREYANQFQEFTDAIQQEHDKMNKKRKDL